MRTWETGVGKEYSKAIIVVIFLLLFLCFSATPTKALITVTANGPGGGGSQTVPDAGGPFNLNLPLNKNAVNTITVTAIDASGNKASQDIKVTQLSLDQIVVSQVTTERLSVEQVTQLVNDGVIKLADPANYNVSKFDIVLTIADQPVAISIPIVQAKIEEEQTGWETYRMPQGDGSSGGRPPNAPEVQIVVFEKALPSLPGQPKISIPGVIIIEGKIKSLKEFYNVRLLLMNTSGIFTLKDVIANIEFPDGGLSKVLPADGINSFGNILPGDGGKPGQVEKQFTIRGDEIGIKHINVNFGGTVVGPGIAEDKAIPFNGSATTEVEVKGPPTFQVKVTHPDSVIQGESYQLKVDITNTGDIPAMYASLALDVGADAKLVKCDNSTGTPVCSEIEGSDVRSFGNILPGKSVSEVFTINPLRTGVISSCVAASDQNISLQVLVGTIGCVAGTFPPIKGVPDGVPTVTVLPVANATGIGADTPVTAFFSELMDRNTITLGSAGTFTVRDKGNNILPGQLRFETLGAGTEARTVAIWQIAGGLAGNTEYTVVLTKEIRDLQGNGIFNEWTSRFTTTAMGDADITPPTVTLSVEPPVNPNFVLPGQIVKINAYATDQGSGIARVELRTKDLNVQGALFTLVDQKTAFQADLPPYIFSIDSANLEGGHTYQVMATAYDKMGNAQNATIALVIAASAAPPTVTLPNDLPTLVLKGISVSLTPQVTGGVREVRYYLDAETDPFKTVNLAPYQGVLSTLNLPLGLNDSDRDYSVRVVAKDGLNQTGQAAYTFTLRKNINMPTVDLPGLVNGAQFVTGSSFTVRADAQDPVGIQSVTLYLDGTPIATGTQPVLFNTTGLIPGLHTVSVQAYNNLGVPNILTDPASYREFTVVPLPNGPAPAPPTITGVSYPTNGQVTVTGIAVAGARVDITNTSLGITLTTYANSSGAFSSVLPGDVGQNLSALQYDFSTSQQPSAASTPAPVLSPPSLQGIAAAPSPINLTSANLSQNIVVTGNYSNSTSANVTSSSTFSSSNPAVASVNSSGLVTALSTGTSVITASVNGYQAQVQVSATITTLTGITVAPLAVNLVALGQTQPLAVTGQYTDGLTNWSAPLTEGITYITGNPAIVTVNTSGLITARANGSTQISVSRSGLPALSVAVTVNTGTDPAPTIAILSPATGTQVERGQMVSISTRAQDAIGGVTRVNLNVTGENIYSEIRQVSPASLSTDQTFSFFVSNTAAIGGTIVINLTAEDTGGNSSSLASVTLNVVDQTAPAVNITAPVNQTRFNYGDTVNVTLSASDAVGVSQLRYQTTGAVTFSNSQTFSAGTLSANASFSFTIPFGIQNPDVRILAYARDAAGNERASVPVDIIITDADITSSSTRVTAVVIPNGSAIGTVSYEVTSGQNDLDHVELYFRRNGIGTFNRYTDADHGNPQGKYTPQNGGIGTITFDSTKMGGDGNYEFYSVGVDLAGNREFPPLDPSFLVTPDQTATFSAGTIWAPINSPTVIGEGDTGFEGKNLRISGTTVTVNGSHTYHNVELLNGAVLTHSDTSMTVEYGIHLDLWTLTVDSTSSINVDGRGYLGGNRPGNDCSGQTRSDTQVNTDGSTYQSGGSYGGVGGFYSGGTPNPVYGSFTAPADLGSGGSCGAANYAGGDGGGRIQIEAINVISDGKISANGANGTGAQSGSGSGGSIYLITSTLSGKGIFSTNGGGLEVGGGGGRIAVHFIDVSTKDQVQIQALGGQGNYSLGGNGTIFLKRIEETGGTLVVDGQGTTTQFTILPVPSGYIFDNILIRNNARVVTDAPLKVNDTLSVSMGSILTHSLGSDAGLTIEAGRVEVDGTSAIDVSSKGYRGGLRDGNPACEGITLGGLPGAGARYRSGGTYGGFGGVLEGTGTNIPYGHPAEPFYLGSGGSCGAANYAGGHGGGLIRINATEAVTVQGSIRANGGNGTGAQSGSGSGGSIEINTSRLSGTGTIAANGGINEVGGGGGRIAITYDYLGDPGDDLGGSRQITAFGGHGNYAWGSAGTVLLRRSDQSYGDLYIDDNVANATSSIYTPLTHIGFGGIVALTEDTITTDGVVKMAPNGLIGLEINPNLNQTQTYRIVSNTENAITVNINGKPVLTSVAAVDDTYSGIYHFDNVYFRRGGFLVMGDPLVVGGTMRIDEYGRMTHYDATMSFESMLYLKVGHLEIAPTGSINVDGRGYLGGNRPGNDCSGQTRSDTQVNTDGSTYRSGGSYGGVGGIYGGTPNPFYGSFTNPADLGSGGSCGAANYAGGDGGGWVAIQAGTILLDGLISANGANGTGAQSGSGSGGTVNISVSDLSGTGTIQTNGGALEVGGGGGRIAVYYQTFGMNQTSIKALGGQGNYAKGGNGTIFFKGPFQTHGDLIIDGLNLSTPGESTILPSGYIFDNILIRNNARVVTDAPLKVNDTLSVSMGSILTHSLGSDAGLTIEARKVEVDGTSAIDVSAKGYRGGLRDGNPACEGITLGGLSGARLRSGGTYGGFGGVLDGTGTNIPYGHPAEPFYLGSGGSCGTANYAGGHGGGLIRISAIEAVTVQGSIRANGGNGTGAQSGSGSGGSIEINTSRLSGTGTIAADGGINEVGGGGGRIAITYDYLGDPGDDLGGSRQITAFGGHGNYAWGSAGTVLLRRSDQSYGDLYIDDNVANATSSIYTPLTHIGFGGIVALTEDTITTDGVVKMAPNGLIGLEINPNLNQTQTYRIVSNTENTITVNIIGKPVLTSVAAADDTYAGIYRFDNVYFRRGGFLVMGDPLVVGGTMRIDEYGRMTHYDATMSFESMLYLTVGHLEIASTGSINVDGRGYLGGNRPGNDCSGQTRSDTQVNTDGSTYRSGGSYGGVGGIFGGSPNPVYGSFTNPADLGSGGSCGAANYAGGDGGGFVAIQAGTILLDGLISANGANGTGAQSGSGSGGTVNISVSDLSGTGTIQTNGGALEVGGGGGRIAVYYQTFGMNQTSIKALGGQGNYASGSAGTVHLELRP